MRVKFSLLPVNKNIILPINYNYFLTSLIYKFLKNSSEDYSCFLHDKGYKLGESKKGFKLFTYSMLMGGRPKIAGDKIIFPKSHIQWYIASPVDNFIQHLVTGVFAEGQRIRIGPENEQTKFLVERVETLPKPEFRETMRFTCLSPVTISKSLSRLRGSNGLNSSDDTNSLDGSKDLNGINDLNNLRCHYLRPWEDGFSSAIKNNLLKKYKLIYGRQIKDIEDINFNITIDKDFLNRKNGRITKNINFKGTNIIGFMAPFEVSGSPDLLEIGYEAGFGEKGSMGFGMVRDSGIG